MSEFPIEFRVKLTYNLKDAICMAEFCVSCWNELNETDYPEEAYILSWDYELCEGCREYKRVIIARSKCYFLRMLVNRCFHRKRARCKQAAPDGTACLLIFAKCNDTEQNPMV